VSDRPTNNVTIAFLGVGQMGSPMATRLIAAGFTVRVWNRSTTRLNELVQLGAIEASTPAQAATNADVVITMLPDGTTTESVVGGADGAFTTMASGALWLQMGTIGIEWSERFRQSSSERGILFVDAPVSGSVVPASAGQLIILASGPTESLFLAEQVFRILGRRTFWLGDAGAGSRAKVVLNNWLVDLVELTAETMNVSTALGLDPRAVVEILADAPIGSPYAVAKARNMLDGDFSTKFALKHAFKDASLALDAARSVDVALPLTASLMPTWQRAVTDGAGDNDVSVVYRYVNA
jgi:3-hydroxyisobutyrate dehydrogenase